MGSGVKLLDVGLRVLKVHESLDLTGINSSLKSVMMYCSPFLDTLLTICELSSRVKGGRCQMQGLGFRALSLNIIV